MIPDLSYEMNEIKNHRWEEVRSLVEKKVRTQVWNQVENQVRVPPWEQVWGQVGNPIKNQVLSREELHEKDHRINS